MYELIPVFVLALLYFIRETFSIVPKRKPNMQVQKEIKSVREKIAFFGFSGLLLVFVMQLWIVYNLIWFEKKAGDVFFMFWPSVILFLIWGYSREHNINKRYITGISLFVMVMVLFNVLQTPGPVYLALRVEAAEVPDFFNPELGKGLNKIYLFENEFPEKIFPEISEGSAGVYFPQKKVIFLRLDNNNHFIPTWQLLCHELAHHYYSYSLNSSQKQSWEDKWKKFEPTSPGGGINYPNEYETPSEYFAEMMEANETFCYGNTSQTKGLNKRYD